ncbi:MAG: ABC transporter permease, partial [Peptostreptococcaceae bacterium]
FNGVESKNLKYLDQNAEISEVGLSNILGTAEIDSENKKLLTIKEYDNNAFKGFKVELIEGKLPTNNKEIVVSEDSVNSFAKEIKIGDTINLQVGDRVSIDGYEISGSSVDDSDYIENATEKNYKVVGIVKKPGFEYGRTVTYGFTYLDINEKKPLETINVGCLMKNPREVHSSAPKMAKYAEVENIEAYSDNEIGIYYNNHLLNLIGSSKYKHVSSTIISIVALVTLLVILATISTIYNTFSISIIERKKQFGLLSSIGATKGQIIKIVLTEGLIVSVLGVPMGLLCGTFAIDLLFKTISKIFENSFVSELGLRVIYSPKIILISAVVVLATIFVSVMIPAIRAAKTSPLEAIRNTGDFKFKKVKNSKLIKLIFKTEGVLAYKNIKRNRRRYRSIVISMIVSIVIFISFSGFMQVMLKGESIRTSQMNHNVYMSSISDNKNINTVKIKEEINKLEGVNNFAEHSLYNPTYLSINLKESDFNSKLKEEEKELFKGYFTEEKIGNEVVYNTFSNILNFPGEEFINKMTLKEGSFDKEQAIKENGVILTSKSMYLSEGKMGEVTLTNYKVGDVIAVSVEDSNGEKIGEYNLKIMGITDEKIVGCSNYRQGGLDFITYDEVAKNIGVDLIKDSIYIDVDNDNSIKQISEIADKYQWNFWDERAESQEIRETYLIMQIFVYGFLIVISLVSVTNIINTISTNISLRKKELAIIKSIGVTPKGFNRMVYLESILYGTISLIYAIPLGIIACLVMNRIVSYIISFELILPWGAIVISVIAVYVITLLSAMIPMSKLNKENIIESIRQESI